MLLSFTVFLPLIVLGEVEAEHNAFSETVRETGRHKNPFNHFWSCYCHWKELSQSKEREAGPMRGSFTSDTLWY